MPRRDGFDTNLEMLADFNAGAHEVFVAAYERHFGDGLPDAYHGKPLDALLLDIRNTSDVEGQIEEQSLDVRPLTLEHTVAMREHLTMRSRPEDVHQHYESLALKVGATLLDKNLSLRQALPLEGAIADYRAQLSTGRTRHVGTLKERPAKFSLALGKTFVGEADKYVHSNYFEFSITSRRHANMLHHTTHGFSLDMRPGLPLNGHESKGWLNSYANEMFKLTTSRGQQVERLKILGAPANMIDPLQDMYDMAESSLKRAESLLENK